ncbi:hypothetical protein LTR56_007531 [Elasticomyces elasticus]|nr:hypothetical protein LTR56_007531 [Elasticomyces elasticus]KAK3668147.1 hypothetical protein LTR22_000832 [Elasticomyces elasticus]KAK4906647.1 hypothetical protein LTR49_024216 [Elasticomyces elasticus]KAK5769526.1 hypothetical protein LTS12_000453 [Elasticomyces elasticus]
MSAVAGDTRMAQAKLINSVKEQYNNPQYADLTIKCGHRSWWAHKVIVCPQSPFFAKACDGNFREAKEGVIPLDHDDPSVVEAMLEYMYKLDYHDDHGTDVDGAVVPPIVFNVHILILADKYDILDLAKLAEVKSSTQARDEWKGAAFADAAALVFATDTKLADAMREVVLQVAVLHAEDFDTEVLGAKFREAVASVPALGLALWRRQIYAKDSTGSQTHT